MRLLEVYVFENFADLKGPNVSKVLSSFPWKDESDESRPISLYKDVPLENGSFVQVSLSLGLGEEINSRMKPDWWAVDVEVLYFGPDAENGGGDFVWHHEKQFSPEDQESAKKYAERLKSFLNSKTLDQLQKDPKSGKLSMSKFKS